MIFVNILNEGRVPWINIQGPVFGYPLTEGVYQLMKKDARIMMEIAPTPAAANAAKARYEASKKPIGEKKEEVIETVDKIPTVEDAVAIAEIIQPVETTEEDTEIDSILDSIGADEIPEMPTEKVEAPKEEKKDGIYTREELVVMTKRQMKDILKSRGYVEGPNAGKYHDTVEILVEKVLRTQ